MLCHVQSAKIYPNCIVVSLSFSGHIFWVSWLVSTRNSDLRRGCHGMVTILERELHLVIRVEFLRSVQKTTA